MSAEELQTDADLRAEVACLHLQIFGVELNPRVVERYIAANRYCLSTATEKEVATMRYVVSRHLDVEALELALRLKNKNNLVTRKLQVLFYLVEIRPAYLGFFVNQSAASKVACSFALIGSAARTAFKLLKGNFLLWRYRLV